MFKDWLAPIAVVALAYSSASAQEVRVDIGFLTCGAGESAEVESGNDALSGEPRKMLCMFSPSNGPEDVYMGTYQTIGQDRVQSRNYAMIWVVKVSQPTQRSTGLSQQHYAADRSAPSPLADAQALNGSDKQSQAGTTIVLVALKLLSSLA